MEDVAAQVASPIFFHPTISTAFCEAPPPMSRKRDLLYQIPNFHHRSLSQHQQQLVHNQRDNWNPNCWDWDSVKFFAKPLDSEIRQLENPNVDRMQNVPDVRKKNTIVEDKDDSLSLNLAGGLNSAEEPFSRPIKRVRPGSPGGSSSYPMCQVDDCKEDLSTAKDYHRRHKVCELHSKSSKALVGKQMQRFCQQCSRFHPLSEFDEGKRSCRRRLAGHNRRRRKTQPDDVASRSLVPGNQDNNSGGSLDIVNLLTALARSQDKNKEKSIDSFPSPDRDQLIQILSQINSLPLPSDLAAKLPSVASLVKKSSEQSFSKNQNKMNGDSSPSTMDLLAVLSATLAPSTPDVHTVVSQRSSQSSDSEKTRVTCPDLVSGHKKNPVEFTVARRERSSTNYQRHAHGSDCQLKESRANLPLQLFSPSPGDDSPPILSTSRKYFSSDSSNPTDERSLSSSPPLVQKLFPVHGSLTPMKCDKKLTGREANSGIFGTENRGSVMPLELFKGVNAGADQASYQKFPHQAGSNSSPGSDDSPASLNSDAQDRTGRIIFKLFDKDPSHLPGTLRNQIYNWLSKSPTEMESYIRPGCVVLSLYIKMSSAAWDQLEDNLPQHVNSLVQHPLDSDFWKKGRFSVCAGSQFVSYKDGKIRSCKPWRSWSSPELTSVSPLAVVCGQETSLMLRGRNLANPGTKIYCAYMGRYESKEVTGTSNQGTSFEEISLGPLKPHDGHPAVLGRCFIEVENGFKGNSFPVIIANALICRELRLLESEFDEESKDCDMISEEVLHDIRRPRSKEEIIHFLNELGWLFQRKKTSSSFDVPEYSLRRFKFLLTFSVERDYCALVKTLLDIVMGANLDKNGISERTFEMLSEGQLLNRVVKRRCRKMVDLLIQYYVPSNHDTSRKYIFPPNQGGPGGITPLHLAACIPDSDDVVDALTNDPQEIGVSCWHSLVDANGQSPSAYALLLKNHSYNKLVARKVAERRSGQISMTIEDEVGPISQSKQTQASCAKCSVVAAKYSRRIGGSKSQGLFRQPYIHSLLGIAAVCVCVCLFLRGAPNSGLLTPFNWKDLEFGTI